MIPQKGEKAADAALRDQSGALRKLSDFRGKKVVLYFYPKDNTSGCTTQACNLRDNYAKLTQAGYVILGVSSDNEASHLRFIEKLRLPFSLLADTDKTLHKKYGTWVEKSMYGRKYMGTARTTFVLNEQGIIEKVIDQVNTKDHTSQILT